MLLEIKSEAFRNSKSEAEKRIVFLGEGVRLVRDMFVADTMDRGNT